MLESNVDKLFKNMEQLKKILERLSTAHTAAAASMHRPAFPAATTLAVGHLTYQGSQ